MIGPLAIHRVQNSGIAFGLFASATAGVIVVTTIAVVWMLIYFARFGARHPVIPAASGSDRRQPSNLVDRMRLGHVTDFIDFRVVAGVQPRRHLPRAGVGILLAAVVAADRRPKQVRRHLDVAAR